MYGEVGEIHNQFTSISSDRGFQCWFGTCCLYTSPGLFSSNSLVAILRILIIALSYCFALSKLLLT